MEVPGRYQTVVEAPDTSILCTPCAGENEEKMACFYCVVCNEHLCELCGRAHRRAKISKGHELLDENEMPKHRLTTIEENICQRHNSQQLEYYCKTHDCFCCSACFTLDHKDCFLQYIEDLAVGVQESKEYLEVSEEIMIVIGLLEKGSIGKREEILDKHVELVACVEKFKADITKRIDKLERASLAELESLKDVQLKEDDESISQTKSTLTDIKKFAKRMEDQKKYKQYRQLVISTNKASAKLSEARTRLEAISNKDSTIKYEFEPYRTSLFRIINKLNGLGDFKKVSRTNGSEEDGKVASNKMITSTQLRNLVVHDKSYSSVVKESRQTAASKTKISTELCNDLPENNLSYEIPGHNADDRFDEYDVHYKKFDHWKILRKWGKSKKK